MMLPRFKRTHTAVPKAVAHHRFISRLFLQQICLEVFKLLRHTNRLFLTFHKGGEFLWYADILTDDGIYSLFELSRMGRLKEHSALTFFKAFC